MRRFICAVSLVLLLPAAVPGADPEVLWLVREGRPRCAIVRGAQDEFAAERLQRWFAGAGAQVPVLVADAPPNAEVVIVLGSAASNPLLGRVAATLGLDVDPKGLTDQGYIAHTSRLEDRAWVILAGGGRDGALYAVTDLIHWRLDQDGGGNVLLAPVNTRQVPRLRYRWFWNWDHRMDWGGSGRVGTEMGGGGTYSKSPEAFLIDFKHCVDYMADHKFNGLIIWGFLRDTHGGVETGQELCRYASRRCVRILPGVGTSGYAGYYFEGRHPYNADTWLAEHPELRALDQNGQPRNAPCPSKKANQDWLDQGARWLFKTFEIGGVNLEMGDLFVCYCDDCRKARAAIDSNEPDYYKDMAISHRVTLRTMRALSADAWLSYATYTGYTVEMMRNAPKFLTMIPGDAICQWTLTGMAGKWPVDVRPMALHNLGYLHWCNRSTHTEDDFYLAQVRDICREAAAAGFEGLDTYGELSPERPNAELFYLAWEAFLWDPDMTTDTFIEQRVARLYGGPGPARTLLDILPLIRTQDKRKDPENLARARTLAESARGAATVTGQLRWDRLIAYLDRQDQKARVRADEPRKDNAAVSHNP
jgi:hypothetical protein